MEHISVALLSQLEVIANKTINNKHSNLIQQHLNKEGCGCYISDNKIHKCDVGLWIDKEITGVEFMNRRVEKLKEKVAG